MWKGQIRGGHKNSSLRFLKELKQTRMKTADNILYIPRNYSLLPHAAYYYPGFPGKVMQGLVMQQGWAEWGKGKKENFVEPLWERKVA